MEGGWGFNAFEFDDFEPNIDDSEDFNLGSSGAPKTADGLDHPYQGSHTRKDTKDNAMGSQCISCMV